MSTTGTAAGAVAALAGLAAMVLLGLLTFGVQLTAGPRGLPLAVAVGPGVPAEVGGAVAGQGGDAVTWRVVDPAEAAELLADKEIYGVLAVTVGAGGPTVTATTSGALVPGATQAAELVLRGAGAGVAEQLGTTAPEVAVVPPTTNAERQLPLVASALVWFGGLAGAGVLFALTRSSAQGATVGARLLLAGVGAVLGTLAVFVLALIWVPDLQWTWPAVGFVLLTAAAFALLQGALLRWIGLAGMPVLALLYLMAPSVSNQPPELLDPAYRVLLWSWTPFRITAETLRSLLYADGTPPDVATGWIVLSILAALALLAVIWPRRPAPGAAVERRDPALVPVIALEMITRHLETAHGPHHTPRLTAAAARLAPQGGASDTDRARAAARDVLRPAITRALARST